jgi:hypothetical protein
VDRCLVVLIKQVVHGEPAEPGGQSSRTSQAPASTSEQWRAKCANGPYAGDEHDVFSLVLPRSRLILLMGLIGAIGVPARGAGAPQPAQSGAARRAAHVDQ